MAARSQPGPSCRQPRGQLWACKLRNAQRQGSRPGSSGAPGAPKAASPSRSKPVMTWSGKPKRDDSQADRRLIGLRADLVGIFDEDRGCQLLLEGQLGETDAHDRRWGVL